MTIALGYVRVSTGVQPNSAAVQERAIRAESERRGWELIDVLFDLGESRSTLARPALAYALARLARGDADALIASRLDRLVGSWPQFSDLHKRATAQGWTLLALDQPDVTTADGQLHAHMKCAMAEWERETVSIRTRVK